MKNTIERFLQENHILTMTRQVPLKTSQDHPFGTCFATMLTYDEKIGTFITYGGRIPDKEECDPAVQLWKIHDDLQGYEETFERFVAENTDYIHWLGKAGTRRMWKERKTYWETLREVLGEDLFWQFYRLS